MDQQDNETTEDLVLGTVEEALPNALFRVIRDDTNASQIAYLAGKMRRFRIRVLVGDRVGMIIDPYGGKARINKRL
jgi:translation initiation factor IF-1